MWPKFILHEYWGDSMATTTHRTSSLSARDFVGGGGNRLVRSDLRSGDYRSRILRVVKSSPDGVTANTVAKLVGVTRPTALLALRELERAREVYSSPAGLGAVRLWYPNGRMVHPYLELFKDLRGRTYRFSVQEGRTGPMIQIQERSYSLLQGDKVEGAIFVEQACLEDFQEALAELSRRTQAIASTGAGGR